MPCTCLPHFDARQLNARSEWETSFSCCMVSLLHASVEKAAMQCECHPISRLSSRLALPLRILPALLVEGRNAGASSADSVNNCPPGLLWYVALRPVCFLAAGSGPPSKRLQPKCWPCRRGSFLLSQVESSLELCRQYGVNEECLEL